MKTLILAGVLVFSCMSGAFAAGLGIADFNYLEQQHPEYKQRVEQYQTDIKKLNTEFATKSKDLNGDSRQALLNEYNGKLNQRRIALLQPLDQDVLKAINTVRVKKNLDYVAAKGYVLSGTIAMDITSDVVQQLARLKK